MEITQLGDIYNKTPMSVKKGIVYKITNLINKKEYVGCTIYPIKKRFEEHIYRCLKTDSNTKFCNSVRKYGVKNFNVEIIEECDISIIYEREKFYIKEFKSYDNGLNSTFGGEGCLGYTHSPEIRQKISENVKNGNSHKGKTYEELYGDNADEEREKRRMSVKKGWDSISDEEKEKRVNRANDTKQKNSKYGVELIRQIKQKINEGLTIKQFKEIYPQIRIGFFYELKNGLSWKNIN
jgi:group I intron endonuclease